MNDPVGDSPFDRRRAAVAALAAAAAAAGHRCLRASGGHCAHVVPRGGDVALCGFRPGNDPRSTMLGTDRGSWVYGGAPPSSPCRGCAARLARAGGPP